MTATKKLYLIDGSGFIFRAFHALPGLSSPSGTPVGAVLGFVNMLLKFNNEQAGSPCLVVFDAGRKTFRNDLYAEYKAHRPPPPPELIPQFALVRQATDAFGIARVELEGFEADDVIATYARQAAAQHYQVIIVSSDKDLMQLVSEKDESIRMLDPLKNRLIGPAEVAEKFELPPSLVRDALALAGDSSDNVPGVPRVGLKTAASLLKEYGNLENLLAAAESIKKPALRENLMGNKDMARLSYDLVGLREDVPLSLHVPDIKPLGAISPNLTPFLLSHGFKSVVNRLSKTEMHQAPKNYHLIQDEKTLETLITRIQNQGFFAIDTETTSLNVFEAELVGISFCLEAHKAYYLPIAHKKLKELPLMPDEFVEKQLSLESVRRLLGPVLSDDSILKIGHNIRYDMHIFKNHGFEVKGIADTIVMSYVLDGTKHSHKMDNLAELHLNHQTIPYDAVTLVGKTRITFDYVPLDKALDYAAEDADITLRLYTLFKDRLTNEHMQQMYYGIEAPLIDVLFDMEQTGFLIDAPFLQSLSQDFETRMAIFEKEIHGLAGKTFNIASPKQLGEVLFDDLQLPAPSKTKTGSYSTDSDVLESLARDGHSIAARVLDYRSLAKLKSTYSDALVAALNRKTGRVHTSFAQTLTSTGRLSSSSPNLQNIPIRTEDGKKIRKAFIAKPGFKIVSLDYSQIELRLLAHIARVPSLIKAFQEKQDIHKKTASEIFNIPLNEVNQDQRRKAKIINFSIIYGVSAFGLGEQLTMNPSEAAQFMKIYFERYPEILAYMEETKEIARKQGYVTTLMGRKCFMPDINEKNWGRRQFAERAAINAPIQGSNADIIKLAMNRISALLKNTHDAKMLLQVHDELIFEMAESAIPTLTQQIKDIMESVVTLSIPLTVDCGVGGSWAEAH